MLRDLLIPMLWMLGFSTLLGCSSGNEYGLPVYDACYVVDECVETATLCEELSVDFAGYTYINAICTLSCRAEGAVSSDCPLAWVGRFGSCYPSSVAGGIDDALICFEPCDFDDDCQAGSRCLGAEGLCGADLTSCPIDETDAICVPGPY
jgi:hypothetical protein